MATDKASRRDAEAKLDEARAALQEAADAAADAQAGLLAVVTRDVPKVKVEVLPNNTVGHEGVAYTDGEELELDGPTAIALMQLGHIIIKGAV